MIAGSIEQAQQGVDPSKLGNGITFPGMKMPNLPGVTDVTSQYAYLNGQNFDVAANTAVKTWDPNAPENQIDPVPTLSKEPDVKLVQQDMPAITLDNSSGGAQLPDYEAGSASLPNGWGKMFPGLEAASYSTAAPAANGAWTFGRKLADGGWRLGQFGLAEISSGSQLMQLIGDYNERQQVTKTLSRFNLDASSVPDVEAARAYIWAGTKGDLSYFGGPNFTGDGTPWQREAGQEAIMRIELANPGTTYHADLALGGSLKTIDQNALHLLQLAADQGIQDAGIARGDTAFKTMAIPDGDTGGTVLVARPAGAPDYLQADSTAARAAVAADEMQGSWQGHHLIPAASYGNFMDWARAAYSAGWQPNGPSNVIALPANVQTQAMVGDLLPIHNGSHGDYNFQTTQQLRDLITLSGVTQPTLRDGMLARGIFETVQYENRLQILTGQWHPRVH